VHLRAVPVTAEYLRPSGLMRTYAAEDRAAFYCPVEGLDGTLRAAQAYVDRITRSAWWGRECPPSWLGDTEHKGWLRPAVPRRILVQETSGTWAYAHTSTVTKHRGKWMPKIRLGSRVEADGCRPGWVRAPLAEPWVVLHEMAHILAACRDEDERGHGRVFRIAYLDLVRRWMGPEAARALREGYKAERLTFRRAS
jgi:hypothetical protein